MLEEANYSVVIQAWDFLPGSDFVQNMHKALQETDRTILVLSDDFLKSAYTAAEWSVTFTKDPAGAKRLLIPVRVRECQPDGLLTSSHEDLVGLSEQDAKIALLGAFSERARPKQAPHFPGARVTSEPVPFPGDATSASHTDAIMAQIAREADSGRSPYPPAQSAGLTLIERVNLIKEINAIPMELFNMIVYAVNPPAGIVPPVRASQGQRSSSLLSWAEGPAGCGTRQIQEVVAEVLKKSRW